MPIKAVADKLKNEIRTFGKDFSGYKGDEVVIAESGTTGQKREDVTKFLSSKSKANAKTAKLKFQFQIMESMDIPKDEIHRFADPQYWLIYFPPQAREDLTSLGCRIDWRRSFITTDINPYFDSFVCIFLLGFVTMTLYFANIFVPALVLIMAYWRTTY